MLLAIVLVLAGLAFVVAEVFFVSMGLLSLVAGALILTGDYLAFQQGLTAGWIMVILQIVLIPLLIRGSFKVLPRLPFGRRMLLAAPASKRAAPPPYADLVGREGRSLSDLRPGGTALLGDQRLSVVALGRFLPRGTEIRVVEVEGSEIRVRPVHPLPDPDEQPLP